MEASPVPHTRRLHLTQYASTDEIAEERFTKVVEQLVTMGWIITTNEDVQPEVPDHMPAGSLPGI